MADLLIRDLPEEVVAALDARAKRLGLSRSELVRRTLVRETTSGAEVTADDLRQLSSSLSALRDPDVLRRAWE